ncbi:MAG: lipocalin family protein [Ferruginibacter sp.]
MKQTNALLILILIAGSFLMLSCKKDRRYADTTTLPLLENKNWKLTAKLDIFYNQDIYPDIDTCKRDDLYTFNEDGSLTVNNNHTKCNTTESQVFGGNWTYNSDIKELMYYSEHDSQNVSLTISSISDNTLVGFQHITIGSIRYTFAWTFSKQ